MRFCTKTGNYNHATNRRRRQLAAMLATDSTLRQAINRAHNKLQARAAVVISGGYTPMAGWRMILEWPTAKAVVAHVEN